MRPRFSLAALSLVTPTASVEMQSVRARALFAPNQSAALTRIRGTGGGRALGR